MTDKQRSNIVLIGMPGAGKSTVGVILAKQISAAFTDADLVIQTKQGRTLQEIVDSEGADALLKIEEDVLASMCLRNNVISPGGSCVYSPSGMENLRKDGFIIFLYVDLPTLASRIRKYPERGIVKRPDQTLADLYEERMVLYRKYAELTIECHTLTQMEICTKIIEELKQLNWLKD